MLSAVYRTGQRFGAKHVVDVLLRRGERGVSRAGRTTSCRPSASARDRPSRFWHGVIRQLIAIGALDVTEEEGDFRTLRLDTDAARPILRGETRVMLREDAAPVPREERHARGASALRPRRGRRLPADDGAVRGAAAVAGERGEVADLCRPT